MTTSQSSLFTTIYKLSPFEIGLTFIPSGIGCALGSVIGGQIVDMHYQYFVIKMKAMAFSGGAGELGGVGKGCDDFPIERARLRAVPWYIAVEVTALVTYGWCLESRTPLVAPLVLQFISE
jgi:hypothetical protein